MERMTYFTKLVIVLNQLKHYPDSTLVNTPHLLLIVFSKEQRHDSQVRQVDSISEQWHFGN